MNSVNGKMGVCSSRDKDDPLKFAFGLPWWARSYRSLSNEEKIALAEAANKSKIFGYTFYLKGELKGA